MTDNDAPGAWPVLTPGALLAGFIKRTFIHSYIQNMKALGLVVFKIFLCFSHCKSMGAYDPRGRAIFDPRGTVGRIYKEDHYTLLHTKYESSGLVSIRFFIMFVSLWELSVAIKTKVLIRPNPKPNATFPPSQWCF